MEKEQDVRGGGARIGRHEAAPKSRRYPLCGAEEEDRPYEGTLETVLFHDFVERCLVVPVSEFFRALLQLWGIQLHHLTPSIYLASFYIHTPRDFVECGLVVPVSEFLGILPHFHLFQHFFFLVPIPDASRPVVVGGCDKCSVLKTKASTNPTSHLV